MANITYDLDTSGGLMPLIRALIKPPEDDSNGSKNKKPQHPYYKRPGKGHNHDSCDACGEGGDLICCDRCPASFHLGCYDPPLEEEDIPAGLWLCKECASADAEKPASSKGSRAQSPVDGDKKTSRNLRNNRSKSTSSTKSNASSKKKEEVKKEAEAEKEKEKELTPMEELVKAAKVMNPKQFELPRELRVPCLFPGTDKDDVNNGPAVITVDSSGCVPLPAKLCFVCEGTCKHAPLIACDYCPLLFHQDCLDPPLTCLPTGRWMCPNHVEQFIDWKLVNSVSASERVALWDKFAGEPIDQHAIKIDFIRHARKVNPPFRMKVAVHSRGRVVVPEMVRYHYENPPPLLPSRREHVRCTKAHKRLKHTPEYNFEEEEDDSKPKYKICMNLDCPKYKGSVCPHETSEFQGVSEGDAKSDLKAITQGKANKAVDDSSELSDSDMEYLTSVKRRRLSGERTPKRREKLELKEGCEEILTKIDEQLSKLDERLVKLLAWQRLQQILAGEQCIGPWRHSPLSAELNAMVQRNVERSRLARHGFHQVSLPSELLCDTERARIATQVFGNQPPMPAMDYGPTSPGHSLSDATVRATLTPVLRASRNGVGDGLGRPVPMRLSRFTIGTDSGCDAVLDAARCRRVSRTHAIIFYDEVSGHFELINYSEFGTKVNGVLYACDITHEVEADPATREPNPLRDQITGRLTQRVNGNVRPSRALCGCPPVPAVAAWEGSALVPHGALLQFGCLEHVFSITDARGFPYEEPIDKPAL